MMKDENRLGPTWLQLAWLLALGLILALAFNLSPWLLGDLDWRWAYHPLIAPERVLWAALVLAGYLALAAGLLLANRRSRDERWAWGAIAVACLASVVIQIAAQHITDPDPLSWIFFRTASPYQSGYQTVGMNIDDPGNFLRNFPKLASDYLPHAQRHPPGFILYFYGLRRLFEIFPTLATWIGIQLHRYRCEYWPLLYVSDAKFAMVSGGLLSLLLNALNVVPLYAVGRRLIGQPAALAAALMSPLVPGYIVWAGVWDQAFVLVTACLLWLLYQALVGRHQWAWWLAGGLLSVASFFTHAILVLVGFTVFYTGLQLWPEKKFWWSHRRQLLVSGIGFLVSLSSVWLGYWAIYGVSYLDVYRANSSPHFAMTTHYFPRLFYNPYDFILFLGYILGLLGLAAIWQVMKGIRLRRGAFVPAERLVTAVTLTLVALILSGFSRAEVGRVWAFLMPLALLAAFTVETGPAHSVRWWSLTAGLLAFQLIVMQAVLFTDRERVHLYSYQLPAEATPLDVQVGNEINLVGYKLSESQVKPGSVIDLTLYWSADAPLTTSYTTFSHVYQPMLGLAAQNDSLPDAGHYPTTCWSPGEIVTDAIHLQVKPDAQFGQYDVIVGLYDPANGDRRLPTSGPGTHDLAVTLTQIQVIDPEAILQKSK